MVYIGLGSNTGDTNEIIRGALRGLSNRLEDMRVSSLYRTQPIGGIAQNDFINAVISGNYRGSAWDLLEECNHIEHAAGRERRFEVRFGPRTLDLDILLFHDSVIASHLLTIPHPRLHERRFALVPLLELCPDALDPRSGQPFAQQLEQLPPQGIYYHGMPQL